MATLTKNPDGTRHLHSYVRKTAPGSVSYNRPLRLVLWKCSHPDCTHSAKTEDIAEKRSLCPKCLVNTYVMDYEMLRRVKPCCLDCSERRAKDDVRNNNIGAEEEKEKAHQRRAEPAQEKAKKDQAAELKAFFKTEREKPRLKLVRENFELRTRMGFTEDRAIQSIIDDAAKSETPLTAEEIEHLRKSPQARRSNKVAHYPRAATSTSLRRAAGAIVSQSPKPISGTTVIEMKAALYQWRSNQRP